MIDRFIEALNREAEMSAVEIADILWLAVQLQESESDSSDSSDSSPVEEEKDSDNDTEELKQEQEIAPESCSFLPLRPPLLLTPRQLAASNRCS